MFEYKNVHKQEEKLVDFKWKWVLAMVLSEDEHSTVSDSPRLMPVAGIVVPLPCPPGAPGGASVRTPDGTTYYQTQVEFWMEIEPLANHEFIQEV